MPGFASNVKNRLTFVDRMTIAFICANIMFIAIARDRIDRPLSIAAGYLACLAVTAAAIVMGGPERRRPPRTKTMAFIRWAQGLVRQAYPLLLMSYFFLAVTRFDNAIFVQELDPAFAAMDRSIFGSVPASWLMIRYESFLLSELFHGAYVLYYASIPALALWLYARDRDGLSEYIAVTLFLFYAACLTYIFLPVVGGRFDPAIRILAEQNRYGPFTRIMAFIYRGTAHEGAAFPSTHAMVSLAIALLARRRARPLAPFLAVNSGLILAATVYCGYHYVVDVFAALAYVAALYPVALRLHGRYGTLAG